MSPTPIQRRKARLLLSVVDRHMTDYMRDPKHMTSDQLNDYETLLEIQGELTQVAHAPAPTPDSEPVRARATRSA